MMLKGTHVFLLWTCLPVYASIYPTSPVQATVWTADQPMVVNWTEDGRYPVLNDMGPVTISLWRDTEHYLVRLASDVDPTAKTCQVTVPGWTLVQGSKYTLRFTTTRTKPRHTIYSADFVIVPRNTTTTSAGLATPVGNAGHTTSTDTDTGSGSQPTGSSTTRAPGGHVNANNAAAGRRLDIEKLKFRFVFVMWPVLVGIVMAS